MYLSGDIDPKPSDWCNQWFSQQMFLDVGNIRVDKDV